MQILRKLNFLMLLLLLILNLQSTGFAAQRISCLTGIQTKLLNEKKVQVILHFDQSPPKPSGFLIQSPAQLVFDLTNTVLGLKELQKQLSVGVLQSYLAVTNNQKTRIVFSLQRPSHFSYQIQRNSIVLLLQPDSLPLPYRPTALTRPTRAAQAKLPNTITHLDFRRAKNGGGDFIISLQHQSSDVDIKEQNNTIFLKFPNTKITPFWERKLNVTDFGSPVQTIQVYSRGKNVLMQMNISGLYHQMNYQSGNQLIVNVAGYNQNQQEGNKPKTYSGKKLSLNFQNIGVRPALQLLAQFAGINIVVSDTVTGNISLNVRNIPWDEAMDIIMRTRGLGESKVGDVYLIAPEEEIATQERQQLLAKQQISGLEPLHSELIQINYGKAGEIAALLKGQGSTLLSSRGSVSVDARTNTIWVLDTQNKLAEIKDLIQKLDIPVRQVLIETRIVNVDKDFTRELGIRWGITSPTHLSGTLEGANAINNGTAPSALENISQRLNVDLPVEAATGHIGLALFKIANNTLLDLELSALESEGDAKIIASPRLITANQQEATIESGEEIPYQQATSSGATSVTFKKAVLSLKVTPQITPDHRVILSLKVNQDKRGTPEVLGVPPIDTRAIETQVLVDNGQTVVLGGIFQRTKSNDIERIPFLGSIPVLGNLFRYKKEYLQQRELLIFVTPKIIKQSLYSQ